MTMEEQFLWEMSDSKMDSLLNNLEFLEVHSILFKELDQYFKHEEYEED